MGPKSKDKRPYKRRKKKRHTQRKIKAETGVMCPQAKEVGHHQKLEETVVSPWRLQKEHRLDDTLSSDFWPQKL